MPEIQTATITSAFEARARAIPERDAVVTDDGRFTYAWVDQAANQLAHRLRERGIGRGTHVVVRLERGIDAIVALLGVLKTGAAYVPLPPDLPGERLRHVLRETRAPIVIACGGPPLDGEIAVVDLARDAASLAAAPISSPNIPVEPGDRAYVIYTSGSTGLPKGVAVTHRNLAEYTASIVELLGAANEPLTFALISTFAADLGNTAIFPALLSGGALRIIDREAALDPARYAEVAVRTAIDVLKITPTHLGALLAGPQPEHVLPRRFLLCGGEALRWELAARVRALAPCEIVNHYGPTETTVGALTFSVRESTAESTGARTVPIGKPLRRATAHVVDDSGSLARDGNAGELWIGGAGVAEGYVARPEETATRFVPNPFAPGRAYRTGDLVRTLPSGAIEFLGRIDTQVKVRGYRVELGEIETILAAHPSIRASAAALADPGEITEHIAAYVVAESLDEGALRAHVARYLPDYMVPAAWYRLEALPFTANGKIDRSALPSSPARGNTQNVAGEEALTPTQQRVAEIWQSVLKRGPISAADASFVELGGHSLMATIAVARARSAFGVKLTMRHLFEAPTVAEFAAVIDRLTAERYEAELAQALAELDELSDEEAKALLASERG